MGTTLGIFQLPTPALFIQLNSPTARARDRAHGKRTDWVVADAGLY